jgi:hypothetical protein
MNESRDTATVWRLPSKSTEFEAGPRLMHERNRLIFSYDYETQTGAYEWEELSFSGVVAYRFVDDPSCTADQIDAYDQLVEIRDSSWLAELLTDRRYDAPGLKHLRIYLDDIGCLEVAATGFTPPPKRSA